MVLIVQKFGGTSLASLELIEQAAQRIAQTRKTGNDVIVVASAMGGHTDALVSKIRHVQGEESFGHAEADVALASGEQISAALLALSLQKRGLKSRSWMGWQVPIRTDARYARAQITEIDPSLLQSFLEESGISVIAGFQGVCERGRITTIERGGSDITASALADSLGADVCEIYTDVEGVFTGDPQLLPQARKHSHLSYQEMALMSKHGTKVLHPAAITYAEARTVPIHVRSSFSNTPGTTVGKDRSSTPNNHPIGIAHSQGWSCVQIPTHVRWETLSPLLPELSQDKPHTHIFDERAGRLFLFPLLREQYTSLLGNVLKEAHWTHDVVCLSVIRKPNQQSSPNPCVSPPWKTRNSNLLGMFSTPDVWGVFVHKHNFLSIMTQLHQFFYE
jgi:aspartate kinase